MRLADHTPRQLAAVCGVLLALAALASFSIWGMKPSASPVSSAPVSTAPAAPPAEDGGGEGD